MSFLLEADSPVAFSVTPESTTTSQARKKSKKSSPVWAHTRMPLENEDSDLFYCFYCEQGLTVSWDRGQIEPEIIEMRECLKHWKRNGILNTFFEKTVLM